MSELFTDFTDIDGFVRIPRLTAVTTGPTGRVVAAIQEADEHGSRFVSALWELDPTGGGDARRLTFSEKGESGPVLTRDGSLLFTSARPDPQGSDGEEDVSAIWRLPERGEASVLASTPGGLEILAVADDGAVLAATSVLPGGTLEDDAERRKERKDAKRTAIWHTGMPIRFWDRELGDVSPRLVLVTPDGEVTDLIPDADTVNLRNAAADISPDGGTVATTWTVRTRGAETATSVLLVDVATGERTTFLAATEHEHYGAPRFSRDGSRIAVTRSTVSSNTDTSYAFLEIHPVDGGEPTRVDVGDVTVDEYTWSDDGTLVVAGDLHSRGAILAVDGATGAVRTLADDAVYVSVAPTADGSAVVALRSDVATPARAVVVARAGGQARELAAPGGVGELPGTLEWVETEIDGVRVGGWLCLPAGASTERPAPVMLWIHGGPHASYNAWSWRWCPWLAVARGYAVLMPDPAMSTGYGHAGLNRGWPRRADVVYRECETLLDQVLGCAELDGTRTAMLGASFGGFMANWIAGHTDRFDAIVSHAGLWALEQQHRTTDAAASKMRVHGHEDDEPDWYRTYSPDRAVADISTPVLLTHGNRDYRVPVSEGIRLWWELVSRWPGDPADLPHRFLQMTSENHWVLTPSNQVTWNRTVLAFCDQHVLGGDPVPDVLPW
ncbi:S9 family peptidase [Georgenia alba]|uniref:S9 family peptidase n=1 Tax=Georgenia alba TaxID=2233858 RepID=A0ABW2Q4S5_9MICO